VIFCVVVFASPTDGTKIEWSKVLPENTKTEAKAKETDAPPTPKAYPIEEGKQEFMQDCQEIGHFSKDKCESLWQTQDDDLNNSGGKPIKVPSKMFSNNKDKSQVTKVKYGT
jgi:hypothetical protein